MPTPKLPKTTVRLATSSTFYVLREDALNLNIFSLNSLRSSISNIFAPKNQLTDIQRQMSFVDGLVSFTEGQQRSLDHRYEVDSNVLGQPLEVMGGTVSRSFTIRRAVTYKKDLIAALGFADELRDTGTHDAGLLSNTIKTPFIFIKRDASPEDSGVGTIVTFYRGCLLQDIKRTTAVDGSGSLQIYEDSNVFYAGRQQFTT